MITTFLSLGSNEGDSQRCLRDVFACIRLWERTDFHRISSLYQTEPWGVSSQPDFINAVVSFETDCSVDDIFAQTKHLESYFGRDRKTESRWGPRLIDIDFLGYGNCVIQTDRLTIPHPSCEKRAFVLVPWNEIAANWVHPVLKLTIQELCDRVLGSEDCLRVTPLS